MLSKSFHWLGLFGCVYGWTLSEFDQTQKDLMVSHLDDYMVLLKLNFSYVKGFVSSTSSPTKTLSSAYKPKAVPHFTGICRVL